MWKYHLVNLLFQAASMVPASMGSTWIGLLFPLWVFVVAEVISVIINGYKGLRVWIRNIATGAIVALVAWGALFVCCLFGAVYRDHIVLAGKVSTLNVQISNADTKRIGEVSMVKRDDLATYNKLQNECAHTEGKAEALDAQTRTQASSIDNCQNQAIKLLAPKPLVVSLVTLNDGEPDQPDSSPNRKISVIALTNSSISPVRYLMRCNQPVKAVTSLRVLGSGTFTGGIANVTPNDMEIDVDSPAWTEASPLEIEFYHNGTGLSCNFNKK